MDDFCYRKSVAILVYSLCPIFSAIPYMGSGFAQKASCIGKDFLQEKGLYIAHMS